jgi:hypothetical protein
MAVLVFGIYLFGFCVIGAFVTETLIPKMTRRNCNDSVDPLWPVR